MEESLNSLAQRGMISEGMAQQVAATALQVSRGRRCYEATLKRKLILILRKVWHEWMWWFVVLLGLEAIFRTM